MLDKEQIKNWDPAADNTAAKPEAVPTPFAGEGIFTGEYVTLTPAQAKARKRRGQWIALGLFTFCILIFLITMTRMGQNILAGGA